MKSRASPASTRKAPYQTTNTASSGVTIRRRRSFSSRNSGDSSIACQSRSARGYCSTAAHLRLIAAGAPSYPERKRRMRVVDGRAERTERWLEGPLLVAALLTIPAIALEQSSVGEPWDAIATVLNWTIWTAFLLEVVIMLSVAPERLRWLRNHPLDIAIVVLTPPFLPASLQAARV